MVFDNPDTLKVFGSASDSAPTAVLGQHTPAGAVWVRTFVVAENIGTAVDALERIHLVRPIETLELAEPGDWVAHAIGRYAGATRLAHFQPFVYVVVSKAADGGQPYVYELNDARTTFAEQGRIGYDNGPRVVPPVGWPNNTDLIIPLVHEE